jgi:hypothetical protein
VIAVMATTSVKAQFATGADIVSSYVWRGIPQEGKGGTPNIQPYVTFTTGGFAIGSWASGSFSGNVKEVDLYATYAISSAFSVTLTDYNYNLVSIPAYFDYSAIGGHVFEGTVAYAGTAFSSSVNTMFAGADKLSNGNNAFSTYVELGYQINPISKVFVGGVLNESATYGTSGLGLTNVGLKISKSIAITDKFSLPFYGILGFNPTSSGAFFVAGITL